MSRRASWPVPSCPMSYYTRHLPHWQPDGAALFIPWRLHGSLPSHKLPSRDFISFDQDLDTGKYGPLWLAETRVAQSIAEALHFGESDLQLYTLRAWVVMSITFTSSYFHTRRSPGSRDRSRTSRPDKRTRFWTGLTSPSGTANPTTTESGTETNCKKSSGTSNATRSKPD